MTTAAATEVNYTTATLNGAVQSKLIITERGFFYRRADENVDFQSATKIVAAESGIGEYSCAVTGLVTNTQYQYVAYSVSDLGVILGDIQSFTTTAAPTSADAIGALPGLFSVAADKQVRFSRGNLQYQASTQTWRFAERQYDMVGIGASTDEGNSNYIAGNVAGSDNRQISSAYTGWIDLFGWGTGANPTNTSTVNSDYSTFTDWGVNAISNGGNEAGKYRTLTYDEWHYLKYTRTDTSSKYGVAMVDGINGVIFLPDSWTLPAGLTFTAGIASSSDWTQYQTVNNYTAAQWVQMEAAGAVFIPAAGSRNGSDVRYVGGIGLYWTSTPFDSDFAYYLRFYARDVYVNGYGRLYGQSVRLVSEF